MDIEIISIRYGMLRNRPNMRRIQKNCRKMGGLGYRLMSRDERPTGCLKMMFTSMLARGSTELTFVRDGDG